MERIVTRENLHQFAAVYDEALSGPVRGVLLNFHGLGFREMNPPPSDFERECASRGLLPVLPYYGAWSWMNDTAVALTDQIVAAVYEAYRVDPAAPLIASGGSMGGLASLIYTRYGGQSGLPIPAPAACVANCPVCDLPYHYTERDDLPRTLFSAFGHYPMPLEEAMRTASPLHQADRMPHVPYWIVHGTADSAVNKERHSDRLVPLLRQGRQVEYIEVEGMEHCAMPPEVFEQYRQFIFQQAGV